MLKKVFSTTESTLFSACVAVCTIVFYRLFFTKYWLTVIWILFLLHFLLNVFLQSSKLSCMRFINKNIPATKCLFGKKCPSEARSWVYESGVPLRHDIWFCKRILLLSGLISFNWGHHFTGMVSPHINNPLIACVWSRYVLILMFLQYRWLSLIIQLKLISILILKGISSTLKS